MNADELKSLIESLISHVLFEYNGFSCGIDPFHAKHFDMWCGDQSMTAKSIDEVMNTPFFNGKALSDISNDLTDIEW